MKKIEQILKENDRGIKLDLGCGGNKADGYVGMDIRKLKGVDIVHDLEDFPFPLPDKCASVLLASHVIEHINPARGVFIDFMNECWRLLKPKGRFLLQFPYAGSPGYWQDPTHCNGVTETTLAYFDPLDKSGLYRIYKPKPWKIVFASWSVVGFMEVILEKRLEDRSYEK